MSEQGFRDAFPAFSSATAYPSASVTYWLGIANAMVNAERFGDLADHGRYLFAAHNLTLLGPANAPNSGATKGVASSKTIGKASITYDVSVGLIEGAGHWNLTTYGVQFWQLARMAGAGGLQVGLPETVAVVPFSPWLM